VAESIRSIKDACRRLGISRTTLWKLVRDKRFPQPIRIEGTRKGFLASEIDAWIAARVAERDQEAA
jgi:prophage regulatory protein